MRPLSLFLMLVSLLVLAPHPTFADPLPRSRVLVYWSVGTPILRHAGGQNLSPWEQPTLLEAIGVAYTISRPFEVRAGMLFGQRLDRGGSSAGILASVNLSLPPMNVGIATVVMNAPSNGTNVALALTFGAGIPVGHDGVFLGIGGQIMTYPGLDWPVTITLGPGISYRFP